MFAKFPLVFCDYKRTTDHESCQNFGTTLTTFPPLWLPFVLQSSSPFLMKSKRLQERHMVDHMPGKASKQNRSFNH